jgi:hypothetical protein
MDLGNMRHLGVRGLAVHCLNPKCRHQTVFSADDYPDDVEVPSFQSRIREGVALHIFLPRNRSRATFRVFIAALGGARFCSLGTKVTKVAALAVEIVD